MVDQGAAAVTDAHVVMLVSSGVGAEVQWFEYRPGFLEEIIRVEWDVDTMFVVLPSDVAGWLLRNGYAREMTADEVALYANTGGAT